MTRRPPTSTLFPYTTLFRSPTAIVYANDMMAIAGLSLARSRGVLVPEELSVTGYDDSELSAHLSPPLTTAATGAVERGAIAMRALLAALASEVPEDVLADHTTVARRGSIAAPPRATTRTVPTGVHR